MSKETSKESGPAKAKLNDLISRCNAVKSGGLPPSKDDIESMITLASEYGLDLSELKQAIEAAEKAEKEGIEQTRITPSNAVEKSEEFFKSPEMQHVLNMQKLREEGATFDVDGNGNPPCISKRMAVSDAETIDQNYLESQLALKALEARENKIFDSGNLAKHEDELDEILTQKTNHAKLQANHKYRKETNLTNDQLYAGNEIGSKTTQAIAAKEKEAELEVMSRFEKRIKARKQKLAVAPSPPAVTQESFKNLTVEHVDRGALVSPRSTPNVSQARSQGMSI